MTMFLDLAAVAAVFVADRFHLVPLSKTPFLLLIGWRRASSERRPT
jgi:hypothetical protein